ncbi:MAG: hypothetical protein NXI24_05410 [bacterium]|nr:hypothetical protein [bacterium]
MNNKQLMILLSIVGVVALAVIVILSFGDEDQSGPLAGGEDGEGQDISEGGLWAEAPAPAQDLEKMEEYRNLWPDIDDAPADREAVRAQWKEFVARYPKNIYVPNEYLSELSESEIKERRELLDTIGTIESGLASARIAARKDSAPADATGAGKEGPAAPAEPEVTPEQQRKFFDYKIQELESRIQLVQFTIEKGRMDADQLPDARKELAEWQAKIEEYKQVRATVPGS